jgi:hypothetical protein
VRSSHRGEDRIGNTDAKEARRPGSKVGKCEPPEFRLWHKTDVPTALSDVCCVGKSGRIGNALLLPLITQSGLSGSTTGGHVTTIAGDVTISRAALVIPSVEAHMTLTGTPDPRRWR